MSNFEKKLKKLRCTYSKLSEVNQHFIIGYTEGLIKAQNYKPMDKPTMMKFDLSKNHNIFAIGGNHE